GQYGKAALEKLKASPNPSIAALAKRASEGKMERRPYYAREEEFEEVEAKPADLSKLKVATPKGAKLPASFLATNFSVMPDNAVPRCLVFAPLGESDPCTAALVDVDTDPGNEIVVLSSDEGVSVFKQTASGWVGLIQLARPYEENSHEAFKRGDIKTAEPPLRDLILGGERMRLSPIDPDTANAAADGMSPPSKP
ncbi:MAG: hypothetical protein RL145_706, partial [Pseudomonadota bacterium]